MFPIQYGVSIMYGLTDSFSQALFKYMANATGLISSLFYVWPKCAFSPTAAATVHASLSSLMSHFSFAIA